MTDDASDGPAARISRLEHKQRPVTFGAVAFIALVAVAMVCLEGLSRYHAYDTTLADARVATENITRATAEHAEKTVELVDAVLFDIVERVENDGLAPARLPRLHRLLETRVNNMPALQGLFIYDQDGNWIITSVGRTHPAANNADRAYFRYHRSHFDRGIHLDRPIRSRSSGAWVVPMSRRLQHADGSFAGVALATVPIQYFQDYYNEFDLGRNGAVVLALADGTLVTRRPFIASAVGANISGGPVFSLMRQFGARGSGLRVAMLDHVERHYSYRKLDTLPLVVSAALAKEDIFGSWWAQTYRECAVVALLMAILFFIGYRLFRQLLIRDGLQRELRRMHTRLEASVSELDRLARTDGLTGLPNRRCLGERVELELKRARRQHTALALVMIDIDFFKRYNDTYGHLAGDLCLQRVSAAIAGAMRRPGDLAARYGGEEFSVLLPDTDADGALAVARAICAAVAALQVSHRTSDALFVTVSAGVHACLPGASVDAAALFAGADAALYDAKTAGRNRVMVAPGTAPLPD